MQNEITVKTHIDIIIYILWALIYVSIIIRFVCTRIVIDTLCAVPFVETQVYVRVRCV